MRYLKLISLEDWYLSVVDVCGVLSGSDDPRNYCKVLKHRLAEEGSQLVTDCNQLKMLAPDGKMRETDVLDTKGILRLVQSIPSPNAELDKISFIWENNSKGIIMENNITDIWQNLDEISQIIAKTVPVETIYLFGSYAYGTPNKDSDMDLYIVFKDEMQMRELDAISAVSMALYPVKKIPIDILGLKYNHFQYRKTQPTLERKIAREGIKLYG